MIFKEKITSRRPELAARLTALAAKRMPLSLATAKPQPGAFHPVHEVFVLGLSVHLPPREDTVPRAASCRLPAACQPRLLQHDHQPGPLLPPHLHSGQVQLPSLHLFDLSLLAVQPQLEVLAVVMVAEVLPQEPLHPPAAGPNPPGRRAGSSPSSSLPGGSPPPPATPPASPCIPHYAPF